ncbi:hypothetical protein ACWC1D_27605, partial [Streptomyces sp. NPDC001478]
IDLAHARIVAPALKMQSAGAPSLRSTKRDDPLGVGPLPVMLGRAKSRFLRILSVGGCDHASPVVPRPDFRVQETLVPAPPITISPEFSGSVVAKGACDDLSAMLLRHAGFQQIDDWHGRRHRLPTATSAADRIAMAGHAAEMLRAARYDVGLDPSLNAAQTGSSADPLASYTAGAALRQVTDSLWSNENGGGVHQALDQLLHPEHGAVERLREALETVGEHLCDVDDEAYELADRFHTAADIVSAAQAELDDVVVELYAVAAPLSPQAATSTHGSHRSASRSAALAASPAASGADAGSPAVGGGPAESLPPARPPRAPGSRR